MSYFILPHEIRNEVTSRGFARTMPDQQTENHSEIRCSESWPLRNFETREVLPEAACGLENQIYLGDYLDVGGPSFAPTNG